MVYAALEDYCVTEVKSEKDIKSIFLLFFEELYEISKEHGHGKSCCFGGCYNAMIMFAFNQGVPGVFVLVDKEEDLTLALNRLSSMFDPREVFENLENQEQKILLKDQKKLSTWIQSLYKKFKNYRDKTPEEALSYVNEHYEKIEQSFYSNNFIHNILKTREAFSRLKSLSDDMKSEILKTPNSFKA